MHLCRPVKEDITQGRAKKIVKLVWNYLVPYDKCKHPFKFVSMYRVLEHVKCDIKL